MSYYSLRIFRSPCFCPHKPLPGDALHGYSDPRHVYRCKVEEDKKRPQEDSISRRRHEDKFLPVIIIITSSQTLTLCARTSIDSKVAPALAPRTCDWTMMGVHAVPGSSRSVPCALASDWRWSACPWGMQSRNAPKTRTLNKFAEKEEHSSIISLLLKIA